MVSPELIWIMTIQVKSVLGLGFEVLSSRAGSILVRRVLWELKPGSPSAPRRTNVTHQGLAQPAKWAKFLRLTPQFFNPRNVKLYLWKTQDLLDVKSEKSALISDKFLAFKNIM